MAVPGNFPEELIEEILLKLPIKSLIRFSEVCKSWNSLIKSPNFIYTQLNRTIQSNNQNDSHLLLLEGLLSSTKIFLLHPAHNPTFDVDKKLTEPSAINTTAGSFSLKNFSVVGTCNGLVCLANYIHGVAVIWNPLVRKYVILPSCSVRSLSGFVRFAFGYDSRTNDYKVLKTVVCDQKPSHVEVWSLARGSWMSLDAAIIPPDFKPRDYSYLRYPFVNGALHWVGLRHGVIMTFDMSTELFGEIMMPEVVTRDAENKFISKYRESLALLCKSNENSIHIWVMKEYGSADSWIQLSTLPQGSWTRPLCFTESCDELVLQRDGVGLQSVDLKSKTANKLPDNIYLYSMNSYTESLALLGDSNAVSY
ncbi:F-box protein CPR1-like [Rosa rugosa]|uniref:F-box protein CPR1-like n=1 Tax=Rosa rugosa TaxID=74645 RepID=UPI002B40A6AE|nr:F-box protein CPR1-like [Rosa rugosa]